MKIFFDFLFYRIYWWNKDILKEKNTVLFNTIIGLSAFFILNITTLLFGFFLYCLRDSSAYPKWLHIVMMILTVVITYTIYVPKYKVIIAKFSNTKGFAKRDIYLLAYILVTIILFIFISIQFRNFVDTD